ncbi:MAG: hypothetical protein U1E20_02895 [Methylocystis sp.]|uniref:hypothetical protein n=1 Tax=Methylocystis sp. TaxID=1911079 RepID=UPI00393D8575
MATRRAVEPFALNVSSVGIDIVGLHDVLLRGPAVRDVLCVAPYQYFVKSDRSAGKLAKLLRPFIPSHFVVLTASAQKQRLFSAARNRLD